MLWGLFVIIVTFGLIRLTIIGTETIQYNKGKCPKCGKSWRYIGTYNGRRVYLCDDCKDYIDIYSKIVDRKHNHD